MVVKMNKFLATLLITFVPPLFAADQTTSIRNSLKENIPQLRYCFQHVLTNSKSQTALQGSINLNFEIGTNGRATQVTVTSGEFDSVKVFDCMKNVIDGVQFEIPADGKTLKINQPITLYPIRNN